MSVIIEDKEYLSSNKTFLNQMRMLGLCCDAVLGTEDGGMFRVHRTIMSCCSSYFSTLFKTSLGGMHCGDGHSARVFIVVPNVSADILENIINFAYSGETLVTGGNAGFLFSAADQFDIQEIIEKCTDFILGNLSAENCLGVWKFGKFYTMSPLEMKAFEFTLANFPRIITDSTEFLHLTVDEFNAILKEDSLNVYNELMAWKAIKRWIRQNPFCRIHCVPELLTNVRFPVTPASDLQQIMNDIFLLKIVECKSDVNLAAQHVLEKLMDSVTLNESWRQETRFIPRLPSEMIFCCGGLSNNEETKYLEVYDCRADAWKQVEMKDGMKPRLYHQCVSLNEYIYFIGGNEDLIYISSCIRFDTVSMTHEEIAPMHEMRAYHCSAELSGKIYAIGGFNGLTRLKTMECYTPDTNQWTYVTSMNVMRSDASACHLRNRIFMVGGFDGYSYLQSAEVYDVEVDQWYLLAEMLSCRAGLGCAALGDSIYAIGGCDKEKNLRTVEKYSLAHEQWIATTSMTRSRSNFGTQVLENKIYVMGGYSGEEDLATEECELFEPSIFRWKRIAPLKYDRTSFGICKMSHLKNIRDYTLSTEERCEPRRKSTRVSVSEVIEQNIPERYY